MRWRKKVDWGPRRLTRDEWAVLEALIEADDLDAVEYAIEELTGFMDEFREDVDGRPLIGVTDGQLAVLQERRTSHRGTPVVSLTFCAAGPPGEADPHAFDRLSAAATSLVDHVQAEGVAVHGIRWVEHDPMPRPF
ncbi:hypothetical protein [Nesterenkonia halobia]|uniref:Uncharacterized protein n=1 Tax=Nesterenkonia halobia TaxID=37922 RepID=A0ABP6RE59_9MICC